MRYQSLASKLFLASLLGAVGCADTASFEGGGKKKDEAQKANSSNQDGAPSTEDPSNSSGPAPSSGDQKEEKNGNERTPSNISLQKIFDTSMRADDSAKFTLQDGIVKQDVTLKHITEPVDMTFNQVDRPDHLELFNQGAPATSSPDSFMQTATAQGVLDIVLVIDNSGSMTEEQANLSTKLAPLLDKVKDSDWRVGVITTDIKNGCLRGLIKKGDTNADAAFKTAVTAGIAGSGNEEGIRMAVEAMKCSATPWMRAKSTVAVLIVSDEDNCSLKGSGCGTNPWAQSAYLTDYLKNTMGRTLGTDARVYGLIYKPGDTTCKTGANQGYQYMEAITASSGKAGSICDADYSATLMAISADIATILKNQFELSFLPDAGSVSVKVGATTWTGYTIAGKVITFTDIPPAGSTISVAYTHGAGAQVKVFNLGYKPLADSVAVLIDKTPVLATDPNFPYAVDAVAKTITFTKSAPPAGSEIRVQYTEDLPLDTRFNIGKDAVVSSLAVKVNDQVEKGFSYDAAAGDLVFASAPMEAGVIMVHFDRDKGAQTSYPFSVVGSNPREFKAYDKNTNNNVAVSFANGNVSFAAADAVAGRMVVVSYKNDATGRGSFELPREPLMDSLMVKSSDASCSLGQGISLSGKIIDVNCDLGMEVALEVSYSYRKDGEAPKSFTFDEVKNGDVGQWTVKVNGEERSDYSRNGNTISFANPLPEDAKVLLVYHYEG